MKITKNIITLCYCIIIILSLSNCKPPNPFINLQTKAANKKDTSIKELQNDSITKNKKQNKVIKKLDKTLPKKDQIKVSISKKQKLFDLNKYLDKKLLTFTNIFGKPNLIVKHTKTINFQYHLESCFLDLFFVTSRNDFILKHYETRSTELNKSFNKESCFEEISKLVNK